MISPARCCIGISVCAGGTEIVGTVYGAGIGPLLGGVAPDPGGHRRARRPVSAPIAPPRVGGVDRPILDVLRGDGRATVEELEAVTASSAGSVRRRLHDLHAGGVLHLDVDVDPGILDLPVRTMLWLTISPAEVDGAGRQLTAHPDVAFAATTGSAHVFAAAETQHAAHLYGHLTGAVAALPGIGKVETSPVLRTVKAAVTRSGRLAFAARRRPPRPDGRRGDRRKVASRGTAMSTSPAVRRSLDFVVSEGGRWPSQRSRQRGR